MGLKHASPRKKHRFLLLYHHNDCTANWITGRSAVFLPLGTCISKTTTTITTTNILMHLKCHNIKVPPPPVFVFLNERRIKWFSRLHGILEVNLPLSAGSIMQNATMGTVRTMQLKHIQHAFTEPGSPTQRTVVSHSQSYNSINKLQFQAFWLRQTQEDMRFKCVLDVRWCGPCLFVSLTDGWPASA